MAASESPAAVAAPSPQVPNEALATRETGSQPTEASADAISEKDVVQEKQQESSSEVQAPSTSHLEPPTMDENNVSGSSSFTDISIEKPVMAAYEGAELSKPKTATSSIGKEGIMIQKTRTNATLASLRDQLPHSFKLFAIVVALALSIFLVSLDMTIVSTAIPRITDEFHSLQDVGWYGAAFFLTIAAFQSTWGKLYRYFPLKPSFLASIFIFEVGSLICAVAQNSVTLIVGRAIAGVGGAGVASGAYTIMAFSAPPERRSAFTGIMGAAYGIASVVGPLLGGVFTEHATWRWAFYVNLPIGGAAALVILITFEAPPAARPQEASWKEKLLQMDLPGTFLIMAAVICFLLAIQWGGVSKAWNDSTIIGLFVGFGAILVVFALVEYFSGDRALIQGRLLKNRSVLVACLFIFFFAGSFFLLLYELPIYFQSVDGVSPSDSGVRNIPLLLGGSIFSIVSGGIISATGYYQPFLLLGAAFTSIGSGLIYTLDIGSSTGQWIGYQVLAGVGIGLAIQTAIIVGQSAVPNEELSTVTAMILFFQTIGGAFFVQSGESAFTNQMVKSLASTAPGVDPAKVLATGASSLAVVFSPEQLPGILEAYLDGLRTAYTISIALGGAAFLVACFSKWESIKGKAPVASAV